MILRENSREQNKYVVYHFIYVNFKIRQTYSLVFQVRVMVTTGEISCDKKRFQEDSVGGMYPVSDSFLILVLATGVSSVCEHSSSGHLTVWALFRICVILKLKVYTARKGGRQGPLQKKCIFKDSYANSPDLNTISAVHCCRLLL